MSMLRREGETAEAYKIAEERFGPYKARRYKRRCDGCGQIIDYMHMATVERASKSRLGIHLCKICAGLVAEEFINLHFGSDATHGTKCMVLNIVIEVLKRVNESEQQEEEEEEEEEQPEELEGNHFKCENCEEWIPEDEQTSVVDERGGQRKAPRVCEDCAADIHRLNG